MDLIFIVVTAFCALLLALINLANVNVGKMIDKHEYGGVSTGSLSSPAKSMMVVTVITFLVYIFGIILLVFGDSRIAIIGMVVLVSSLLFSGTAFIFGMLVLNTMNKKAKESKKPATT